MKKIIAILLFLLMVSGITGCSKGLSTGLSEANSTVSNFISVSEETTFQETEEPTTEEPTTEEPTTEESTTEESTTEEITTETPKDNSWKKVYIDYLNTIDVSNFSGFQLVYIDYDDIPELIAMGSAHISPCYLCWVNNGFLCQGHVSFSGFRYLEKQNKYLCREGWTGTGWDTVYRINGGEEEEIEKGNTCDIQGQEYYRWDGVDMSKSEYDAKVDAAVDPNTAKNADNLKSYEEICTEIRNY